MKIGDLIKVNTDDPLLTGTWIIVEELNHSGNAVYRIVGIHHDGLESDIAIDAHWAKRNMKVISSCG